MQNEIPIIQKIYDFYRELYLTIEKMPRKDKYTLGGQLSQSTFELLKTLIRASSEKQNKYEFLQDASVNLDFLKILLRLAEDIKSIDQKKYLKLEGYLQEIGKMLGGWLRSTKTPL